MKLTLPRSTFGLALLFAFAVMSTSHQANSAAPPKPPKTAPPYTITWLGTLGGSYSAANGMNKNSSVVGASTNSSDFWYHAFLNVKDVVSGSRVMIDLHDQFKAEGLIPEPVLHYDQGYGFEGWFVANAKDINDKGQIVGALSYVSANSFQPQVTDGMIFRYTPDDPTTPAIIEAPTLDNLGNVPKQLGTINAHGDIVAFEDDPYDPLPRHPVVCMGGTISWVQLPLFKDHDTLAFDINDSGQVCGPNSPFYRAWRNTPGIGYQDLGSLFKGNSAWHGSFSINNNGQVAGFSAGSTGHLAFRYTNGQGMKSLGTLGGTWSSCDSYGGCINSSGDVIGYSQTSAGNSHMYLYTDTLGMVDLETAITNLQPGLIGLLGNQLNLNDSRQVCGTAGDGSSNPLLSSGHTNEAYLLTPTPTP